MERSVTRTNCLPCNKIKATYLCQGCSQQFCFDGLTKHRANIRQEFSFLQTNHDLLRQRINHFHADPTKHPYVKQVRRWEKYSIQKIKETAEQYIKKWLEYSNSFLQEIENKLNDFAKQIQIIQQENEFNEIDLNDLKPKLNELEEELHQLRYVSIEEQSTSLINNISFSVPLEKNIRWKQSAMASVGQNTPGSELDQLNLPTGICFDDQNQSFYIVDCGNHRIIEWKLDGNDRRVAAGGKGQGNRLIQLNQPRNVVIDRQNNDLIIADLGNRRVMRWSRRSNVLPRILIKNIDCFGLAWHEDGALYVSDSEKNEVRRWKRGETRGTLVAGGHGKGNRLNQLNSPTHIFVDDDQNLYISDCGNDRVMKWMKNAKEGIVVAGGNGQGDRLTQLSAPQGVIVDRYGQIFIVDFGNDRVVRWCEEEKKGRIVVGGNGEGKQLNQLHGSTGLSFDSEDNLYVADSGNHRIQIFQRDFH